MSRLAMDQITITDVTDGEKGVSVKIVTPFYALGTTAPDKPTTNTPESVWTTTEPEYVKGNNLYTTQRTVLEDSTFLYSDVSLDSSYKASEQAITTADMANTTSGEAKTTAGEAKTTATEAKTTADEAKTASTTNKNNLESEITARNQAIEDLKTSVGNDIDAVSQKAADAQNAADDASNALTTFRTSTESKLTSVDGLVSGLRTDVDAFTNKANTLSSGLDSANTNITNTSDKLTGLTTTVSNVSKTADDSMALSTTNHQDLAGFKTTVQQTYSTKEETLSQVTTVNQKADAISATLSKDYQKTGDADSKYATKTALQATADGITASVSETYATKSVVDALKNIADNAIETWQGHGIPSMTGKPASDWTTDVLKKQHSGDMYYDLDSGYSYRFGSEEGTAYEWSKIADSDITKAMQAAAAAQSTADKNTDAVSKLNTDIPVTYATKSEVKVTTDGIKADVVEAKRIGQTGVDNAAALAIRADGIDATLSQQATNIDKNVKSITQLGLRADGISTSVSQVEAKVDVALANAQNYIKNPQFHGSNLDSVRYTQMDVSDSNAGTLPAAASTYGKNTSGYDCVADAVRIRAISGHTYRIEIDSKPASDMQSTETEPFGLMYWYLTADNPGITSNSYKMINTTAPTVTDWTHSKMEFTYAGTEQWSIFRPAYRAKASQKWLVTNFSCMDVTEVVTAKGTADSALSKATTAQQNLDGFKTQVTQTYETKEASSSKATTAQQNLDGFKNTVSSTYATKTALDDTNGNVTQAQKDATSALSQYTTLSQDVNGFKQTVDQKYETKEASQSKNSTLSQDLSGFKTSVSQTYTKQTDFNNLQISGGRNIARDTKNFGNTNVGSSDSGYLRNYINRTNGTYNGCVVRSLISSDATSLPVFEYDVSNVSPGEYYTMSFWAKGSGTMRLYCYGPAGGYIGAKRIASSDGQAVTSGYDDGQTNMALSSSWKRYWVTWKLTDNPPSGYLTDKYFLLRNDNKMTSCDVAGVMIEKGNKASEWAPAPEDIETTYATQSSVQQTATSIKTEVASIYATQDTVSQVSSTVTQNATEWGVNLDNVNGRLDGVDTTTSDLSDQLTNTNNNLQSVNDTLSDEIGNRQAYMRFSKDADGKPLLELGDSANEVKAQLRNDRFSFVSGDIEVAYVSDDKLYINTATVNSILQIGNFAWVPRSDGHLILSKI